VPTAGAALTLDLTLLSGFTYACRPDCGLCCYAEPTVRPDERAALLRIVPEADLGSRGREGFLRAHQDGGACRSLKGNRCQVHAARPSPCQEFPLTAYVSKRVQVTAILSCPGVDLGSLARFRGAEGLPPPKGFETETSALESRLNIAARHRLDDCRRRGRRVERELNDQGRWERDEDVRAALRTHDFSPRREDFPSEDPPAADDGIELLPMLFDHRPAPIALSSGLGGWEVLELRPTGGVARSLGVVPPPNGPPAVSEDGQMSLSGYLRYWLARDALFGAVHLDMLDAPNGSVSDWVAAELRRTGALVLSRAYVLAAVHRGEVGTLSQGDVLAGVRAVDQDLLDRETWGERL
jgi:Putative zinc- or iron-chelating domain